MTTEDLMAEVAVLLPGAELVDDLTNSGRAALARVRVDGQTFVAKRHETRERFQNEVEALRTLPAELRPGLVAVGERTCVMEDVGDGDSLADVLLGDDPARARDALLLWATTLGQALRPTMSHGARPTRLDLRADVDQFLAVAASLDCAGAIDDDVARVEDALSAPTPWFAFGPSDACPDNNRLMPDGSMRLFDFEGAGWRHAASEAAYAVAPFCTCWCVAALPEGTTDTLYAAFVQALQPSEPDAFASAVDAAVVAYMFQMARLFGWFVDQDPPMAPTGVTPPARGRQYLHGRLTLLTRYGDAYPSIAALADDMAAAMHERWPDCTPLPLYPAFQ